MNSVESLVCLYPVSMIFTKDERTIHKSALKWKLVNSLYWWTVFQFSEKISVNTEPSGEFIVTPSICLHSSSLNLKFLFIVHFSKLLDDVHKDYSPYFLFSKSPTDISILIINLTILFNEREIYVVFIQFPELSLEWIQYFMVNLRKIIHFLIID